MSSRVLQFEGIGTHWWIEIFDILTEDKFLKLKIDILNCVSEFGRNYSRFREDSFISQLNKNKILKDISEELKLLFRIASSAKYITDGHFNITVGSVLNNMGYDKDYSFEVKAIVNDVESDIINIDNNTVKIGKTTSVDLGGIGKGFLIDKVRAIIKENNIKYFFINAGGDIFASSKMDDPIEFALENPFNTEEMIGKIKIKNRSIASSSASRRKWFDTKIKKTMHHLINMKTKQNDDSIAAVYTRGYSALDSDLASTCLFVSPSELYSTISEYFSVEYLIVLKDGKYVKSENYSAEMFYVS